ncbi:MAG TPA: amidase [Thermodesulfobacteriota bacterium]|nr:amidase [Thermodesulfobacteriota bacterium]
MEPYELSIREASDLMKKKELSPVELVNSCIDRIEALDGKLIAWALLDKEGALQMARRCEMEFKEGRRRGTLHGIPVGIKDIFYTAGLRTEAGSRTLAGFVPSYDAAAVERLKEAGAIILGKTQTTEFAYLDPAPTRNPWNLDHTPGGSSSGSAAAVAACMCPIALGSQTGGSTLRPAAYNGIVGFKAQHGRISTYGVVPVSWTLDHVGILTRTVEDAAITFQAIAGYDHRDLRSLNAPVPNPLPSLKGSNPPHLGLAREYFFENADEEMKGHTEEVAQKLCKAGAKVTEVVLPPDFRLAADINPIIMGVEAATYHEEVFSGKKDLYRPNIKQLIEEGLATPVTSYVRAQEERLAQRAKITPLLLQLDGLLTPGAPGVAPKGLESTGNAAMQRPWSTMGIPTIALPTGLNQQGLPLGVQLVGAPFAEDKLFAVASWCEKALHVNLYPPLR